MAIQKLVKRSSSLIISFLFVLIVIITLPVTSKAFNLEEIAVETPSSCTKLTPDFEPEQEALRVLYKSDFPEFQKRLADMVMENNNIGGAIIHFPGGDKTVFRASILSRNLPCIAQLVKEEGVKTIINLYTGDLINEDELASEEQNEFARMGAYTYIHALNFSDEFKPPLTTLLSGETNPPQPENLTNIQARIANIVRMIAVADGNIFIHCVGGIHRTGVVYGVLQKCVNKVPIEQVVEDYKTHAGWELGKASQKLYRPIDVELIRSFECQLVMRSHY